MVESTKYALITGASSGIGYELAKLFAEAQYHLIIIGRNERELTAKAEEFRLQGITVITMVKDLFDRTQVFSIYDEIKAKGIHIDILVNDAGQGEYGLFKDTDIHRELDIIELNISALVILTKLFLNDMVVQNRGKILNLASIASKAPGPWQAVYHGTKAFVLSFTEAIREEVKDFDITITSLLPGVTDTDFFNKANMNNSKAVQDKNAMADPADVARDGFEALMAGKDKVISGFKNKVQVAMANLSPDNVLAHQMNEQQKPVE